MNRLKDDLSIEPRPQPKKPREDKCLESIAKSYSNTIERSISTVEKLSHPKMLIDDSLNESLHESLSGEPRHEDNFSQTIYQICKRNSPPELDRVSHMVDLLLPVGYLSLSQENSNCVRFYKQTPAAHGVSYNEKARLPTVQETQMLLHFQKGDLL